MEQPRKELVQALIDNVPEAPSGTVRVVDGKGNVLTDEQLSRREQMLANKLVTVYVGAQLSLNKLNRKFWISVACNVVLLALLWIRFNGG